MEKKKKIFFFFFYIYFFFGFFFFFFFFINSIREFGGEGRPLLDYVYEKVKDVVRKGNT